MHAYPRASHLYVCALRLSIQYPSYSSVCLGEVPEEKGVIGSKEIYEPIPTKESKNGGVASQMVCVSVCVMN